MASAKKLPSGSWRVNLYVGKDDDTGMRMYKSFTAATKKEAEFMAAQFNVSKKAKEESGMTVKEAIQKYIESKDAILSPTTIVGYKRIKNNNLQALMTLYINQLTNETIQKAINNDATTLSPKTISNAIGLLSTTLNAYRPDFALRVTLPQKKKRVVSLLEPKAIFNTFKNSEIELPVLLAMWMGMRMSEIRGLRKSDISGDYLVIQNTMMDIEGKAVLKMQTKTASSTRKLRIPLYIKELIRNVNGEYLTTLSSRAIYARFTKTLKRLNLTHMSFHDLRHLNASIMVQLGIPDKYAMERGGWSTNDTLKNVYQHTFSSEREAVDDTVDNYLYGIMQHEMQHEK